MEKVLTTEQNIAIRYLMAKQKLRDFIEDKTGSEHVDKFIWIIIGIVIGGISLAFIYTMFKNDVFVSTKSRIDAMFSYSA